MSAPEPNFDQLLSDHLDGQLDEADALMLRESMRRIPDLQSQFDALVADRQDLRAMFAADQSTGPRLSHDFAAHVLTESYRRGLQTCGVGASAENRETSVVRQQEQPSVSQKSNHWAMVIGILTTAAAVLLIVVLTVRKRHLGGDPPTIAQHQAAPQPTPTLPTDADQQERMRSRDLDNASDMSEMPAATSDSSMQPRIAAADQEAAMREVSPGEMERVADPAHPSPSAVAVTPAPAAKPTPAARLDRSASVSMGSDGAKPGNSPFRGAMMVYEIRLSPQGRRENVLSEAMRQVELHDAKRLSITRDVIAAAKQADTFDEDTKFQLVFLQASAKKIDRLFLNLRQKPRSVEAIGLSLVTDAPLLQMAGDLTRVDATKIQHNEPLSFEIENNDSDKLSAFRDLLEEQTFLPLQPIQSNEDRQQPDSLSSASDDVVTRVLILVR